MAAIALELKLECRYCGNGFPLNALSPLFLCHHCMTEVPISESSWRTILEEIQRRVLKENDNRLTITGNIIPFFVEGHQCIRLYGKEEPKTRKNKTIPMKEIISNISNNYIIFNNESVFIRPVPNKYSKILKGVQFIVGEEETQINSGNQDSLRNPETPGPVSFNCPQCSGVLKADGTKRIFECNYCNSNIFIPDPLWFRFHPSRLLKRWYLWYGESFPAI